MSPSHRPAISQKGDSTGEKKSYAILFVDDEKDILKALVRIFRKEDYTLFTANSAAEAWQTLKQETIHVIITDLRMPKITGVDLLKKTKAVYPDIIRIMLTGYADIEAVMEAVNKGAVYKFVTKPWNDEDLKLTVRLGLLQYNLLAENRKLRAVHKEQAKNIDKLSRFTNKSRLGDLLVKKKLIGDADLAKAITIQVKTGETLPAIFVKMASLDEQQIIDCMKQDFGVKEIHLEELSIPSALSSILPKEVCLQNMVIPIKKSGNSLTVAMADPTDAMKQDALKFMTGLKINAAVSSHKEILVKIEELYQETDPLLSPPSESSHLESHDTIVIAITEEDEALNIKTFLAEKEKPSTVKIVNAVIADALRQQASDVHIEPKNQYVMVRYRINGLLFDKVHLPLSIHSALVSRIKVIAELDISEKRRPQDGRVAVKTPSRMVDMRLSTLPTIAGEKIVFRILDRNSAIKDIDELGMSDQQIEQVTRLTQKPQGCLLVTGPTGSGKTSTLYSLIQRTATIHRNYTTIEDPVEYYMDKAEQVMIKEKIGLTFPVVLRSLLRQDPDTIMLGEIRDFETAEVAFHAALTGHSVLSTLHTNSCVATITRLLDMGVKSHVISSAMNGVISQRLVRRICPNCMVNDSPSPEMTALLGLDKKTSLNAKKGQGCPACENTGYVGRTGIYEVLSITTEIERLLQQNATEAQLKKATLMAGMKTLFDHGMGKINMGITTCDEVLRVLGPQNIQTFKCPSCQKILAEQYAYCPYCAKPINPKCQTCGCLLEDNWQACPDCGSLRVR